jgi:hypothetical protein
MAPPRHDLRGVKHPLFTRVAPTVYLIRDLEYPIHTTIHVGQIAEYLEFDEELRSRKNADFTSMPLGYSEFCSAWNDNAAPGDKRRLSTVFIADDPQDSGIVPSDHPPRLYDFFITQEQVGLGSTTPQPVSGQTEITHEYAVLMAAKQKREREGFEERERKRARKGITSIAAPRRRPYVPKKAQPTARYFDVPQTSRASTSGTQQSQLPAESSTIPEEPVHVEAAEVVSESQPMDLEIHD